MTKLTRNQKSALNMLAKGAGRPRQVTVDALIARGLVEGRRIPKLTEAGRYAAEHGEMPEM